MSSICLSFLWMRFSRKWRSKPILPSERVLFVCSIMYACRRFSISHKKKQPYRVDKPKRLLIPTNWISSALIVCLHVLVWRNHQYIIPLESLMTIISSSILLWPQWRRVVVYCDVLRTDAPLNTWIRYIHKVYFVSKWWS